MPRKPKPQPDNPEQYRRFLDTARDFGAEKPSPDLDRVLKKVAAGNKPTRRPNADSAEKREKP